MIVESSDMLSISKNDGVLESPESQLGELPWIMCLDLSLTLD